MRGLGQIGRRDGLDGALTPNEEPPVVQLDGALTEPGEVRPRRGRGIGRGRRRGRRRRGTGAAAHVLTSPSSSSFPPRSASRGLPVLPHSGPPLCHQAPLLASTGFGQPLPSSCAVRFGFEVRVFPRHLLPGRHGSSRSRGSPNDVPNPPVTGPPGLSILDFFGTHVNAARRNGRMEEE